jgi:hypothetical protein
MVSGLLITGFLAAFAAGQPPVTGSGSGRIATKQPAPGPKAALAKADPVDAAVKAALANDPDVQVARAKVLLAEAEMAKARQAVVLKVMSLRAAIQENESAIAAAQERYEWTERLVRQGTVPQSQLADARMKLEAAKFARDRAMTELKLLTDSGKEVGMKGTGDGNEAAFQSRLAWLARGALIDPSDPDSSSNTLRSAALAALYLSGTKTPVGAVPDRIRAALDQQVKIGAKGEKVSFEKALEVFKRDAGLDVPVRGPGDLIRMPVVVSQGEEMPVGAWFQLYQDYAGTGVVYVRDYGLLFTDKAAAPPDAPTLTEFWKQKQPSKGPKEVVDTEKKQEK